MNTDIIIVGAGAVGATLASACAGAGFSVSLVESREPVPFRPGSDHDLRVVALSPGSETVFRTLGVWPLITGRRAHAYRGMCVWDSRGSGEIRFDALEVGASHLGHIIENVVIQDALAEHLEQYDQVHWFRPRTVASLEVGEDQAGVELDDGTRLTAGLVVGADGARSRIRDLAGIPFDSRPYHQRAVVATVYPQRHHQDTAWQRFLPTGPLAFLPLDDGLCSIVWSTTPEHAEALLTMSEEDFRLALGEASDFRLGEIEHAGPRAAFPLRGAQARRYVQPRVALAGDAAHVIHPLAGQGMNLGIMDAAMLAQVLAERRGDPGSLRTLRRYERARRGDNEMMMRAMEGFRLLFGNRLAPVVWFRNLGLSLADAVEPVKSVFMRIAMDQWGERPRLARGLPLEGMGRRSVESSG